MLPGLPLRAKESRQFLRLRRFRMTSWRWDFPMDDAIMMMIERALSLASESFIAASGPGGQNVNKVATAVQLRLNVYALRLPPEIFQRFKGLAGSRMTAKGELVLTARRFRTQEANRADARARLEELVREAFQIPEKRAKSRLNRIGKEQRLAGKKLRSTVKAGRGKVQFD